MQIQLGIVLKQLHNMQTKPDIWKERKIYKNQMLPNLLYFLFISVL